MSARNGSGQGCGTGALTELAPRDIARDLGWAMGRAKTAFSYADLADEAASRYWDKRDAVVKAAA